MVVKIMITMTASINISVVEDSVEGALGEEEVVGWIFWGVCDGLAEVVGERDGDTEGVI